MDEHDTGDEKTLHRLQTRAALYAAPDTLVTAREFARAMGVRALRAGQLNPPGLVLVGGSKRAPFREWLVQIERVRAPSEDEAAQPSLAELRRPVRHR